MASDHRQHYVVAVRRHERVQFLVWYSDEVDGVLTAADLPSSLLAFDSDAAARAHGTAAALAMRPDQSAYFDLDELGAWIDAPNPYRLRPDVLLNAWNLLGDVARSVGDEIAHARLLDRRGNRTYDELFRCCSIPALDLPITDRPSPATCEAIAAILRHGLACFDRALRVSPPATAPR